MKKSITYSCHFSFEQITKSAKKKQGVSEAKFKSIFYCQRALKKLCVYLSSVLLFADFNSITVKNCRLFPKEILL